MHRANQSSMHNILHIVICGTVRTPASEDHAFHAAHCSQERVTVQPLGSPVLYWAFHEIDAERRSLFFSFLFFSHSAACIAWAS